MTDDRRADLSRIEGQAPNAATLERAHSLAKPRRWTRWGRSGQALWGLFPTRGALNYQVLADTSGTLHYCNCASRLMPCKHVLALLLLAARQPRTEGAAQPPGWLAAWRERARHPPGTSQADKKKKGKAPEQRLAGMEEGAKALLQWLADLVRQGLSTASTLPPSYWEQAAASLVDAKLGGIARRVRRWPDLLDRPDGLDAFLDELGSVYLLARAVARQADLPGDLRHTTLALAGRNVKKKEVLAGPGTRDTWLVAGMQRGEDNTLFFRRVWLAGARSGRYAMLLDFAHGAPEFEGDWKVGMALDATVHFYPGAAEYRALLGEVIPSKAPFSLTLGAAELQELLQAYARDLARNPWSTGCPCLLREVRPGGSPGRWTLQDRARATVPLLAPERAGWQLLAISGGHPIHIFGLWDGRAFLPLSAQSGRRLVPLAAPEQDP